MLVGKIAASLSSAKHTVSEGKRGGCAHHILEFSRFTTMVKSGLRARLRWISICGFR